MKLMNFSDGSEPSYIVTDGSLIGFRALKWRGIVDLHSQRSCVHNKYRVTLLSTAVDRYIHNVSLCCGDRHERVWRGTIIGVLISDHRFPSGFLHVFHGGTVAEWGPRQVTGTVITKSCLSGHMYLN